MFKYSDFPESNPAKTPTPGTYYAVITGAEVRESQNTFKLYLNIAYTLFDKMGNNRGIMYDVLTDSDKEIPRYKLKRFIDAIGAEFKEEFDFTDLKNAAESKAIILTAKISKTSDTPRLEVDVFKDDIYYPLSDSMKMLGVDVPAEVLTARDNSEMEEVVEMIDDSDMPF